MSFGKLEYHNVIYHMMHHIMQGSTEITYYCKSRQVKLLERHTKQARISRK